jgi:excisionase family DNA binding protein
VIPQDLEINPNTYYTPTEAAAKLRISRASIRRMLESGQTQGIKVGRQWRILGSDLLRLPREDVIEDARLTQALTRLSEPAFINVWDNDEDSVYDGL